MGDPVFTARILLFSEEPYRIPEALAALPDRLERDHGCYIVRSHSWFIASCKRSVIKAKAVLGIERRPGSAPVIGGETGILVEVSAFTGEDLVSAARTIVEEGSALGLKSDLKI